MAFCNTIPTHAPDQVQHAVTDAVQMAAFVNQWPVLVITNPLPVTLSAFQSAYPYQTTGKEKKRRQRDLVKPHGISVAASMRR